VKRREAASLVRVLCAEGEVGGEPVGGATRGVLGERVAGKEGARASSRMEVVVGDGMRFRQRQAMRDGALLEESANGGGTSRTQNARLRIPMSMLRMRRVWVWPWSLLVAGVSCLALLLFGAFTREGAALEAFDVGGDIEGEEDED
jgi:hypothetical protein